MKVCSVTELFSEIEQKCEEIPQTSPRGSSLTLKLRGHDSRRAGRRLGKYLVMVEPLRKLSGAVGVNGIEQAERGGEARAVF